MRPTVGRYVTCSSHCQHVQQSVYHVAWGHVQVVPCIVTISQACYPLWKADTSF
jgi:hypothetical protein